MVLVPKTGATNSRQPSRRVFADPPEAEWCYPRSERASSESCISPETTSASQVCRPLPRGHRGPVSRIQHPGPCLGISAEEDADRIRFHLVNELVEGAHVLEALVWMKSSVSVAPLEHPMVRLWVVLEARELVNGHFSGWSPPCGALLGDRYLISSNSPAVPHLITRMRRYTITERVEALSYPRHFQLWNRHAGPLSRLRSESRLSFS
jgi:hypothetical protein